MIEQADEECKMYFNRRVENDRCSKSNSVSKLYFPNINAAVEWMVISTEHSKTYIVDTHNLCFIKN